VQNSILEQENMEEVDTSDL